MPTAKPRIPTRRRHQSGNFFVRWGGRDRYFGHDPAVAQQRYLTDPADGLPAWKRWKDGKAKQRERRQTAGKMTVSELAERFLDSRAIEGGDERREYYRKHLRRFLLAHGLFRVEFIRQAWLQRIKDDLLKDGKAPRTVNHDIQAVKTCLQWAMDHELIEPVNLRGVKKVPVGAVRSKARTRGDCIRQMLKASADLRPWLVVNYLTAARPIEIVRAVNGHGSWIERGVLEVPNKSGWKSGQPRCLLFSAEAFAWLRKCEPFWTRLDSYSTATRRETGAGPHTLRHSAATHLLSAGVHRSDVDSLLGHYPSRVSLTYQGMPWRVLRRLAARLTVAPDVELD